jgi:3'-phosphoadenosine 5'-phosphosulfate sulfotransferase (PAPS reductase)/FAD synthetase
METPEHIINRAIETHEPTHIFGLFSGGDDSLTVTHFAREKLGTLMDAVVNIHTGIALPEAIAHVDRTCEQLKWPLLRYHAKDLGQDYEQLVLAYGFPGPDHHTKMFNRLKERALRALTRDYPGGNIMLISGLRKQESGRRMRLKSEAIQKDGRRVWCAPFFYWSNDEVRAYRESRLSHVPKNPAKEYLCMSGECLCGAYARKGELAQIEAFFPEMGAYLRDLERRVRANGFPWGWDESPPKWWSDMKLAEKFGQADAFEDERDDEIQMLCSSCEFKKENEAA